MPIGLVLFAQFVKCSKIKRCKYLHPKDVRSQNVVHNKSASKVEKSKSSQPAEYDQSIDIYIYIIYVLYIVYTLHICSALFFGSFP